MRGVCPFSRLDSNSLSCNRVALLGQFLIALSDHQSRFTTVAVVQVQNIIEFSNSRQNFSCL